ncbi:hypothetical protein KGG70_gp38 [Streptomyces phage Celia]|uniref:Uncharacterized protein n=1 Tax=Streptomyces phage Celia TaxID=2590946 RepID=A0A516KRD0_9CAUD|nr:hypothetical protein KGG70_gp38 [Streptomyces phage Celia]QDP44246.1 hypothetical protein SEA_CELIA_43 [Streptomyces phage Celia]QFG10506.1 hypothetical protein SEA_URZA_43 [Streptomyces phage Urza]QJD50608.1 hypothetical protein SEA_ITZA_43 [Streptomyces phage Itza]
MKRRVHVYARIGGGTELKLGTMTIPADASDADMARYTAEFYRGVAAELEAQADGLEATE